LPSSSGHRGTPRRLPHPVRRQNYPGSWETIGTPEETPDFSGATTFERAAASATLRSARAHSRTKRSGTFVNSVSVIDRSPTVGAPPTPRHFTAPLARHVRACIRPASEPRQTARREQPRLVQEAIPLPDPGVTLAGDRHALGLRRLEETFAAPVAGVRRVVLH